MLADKFTTQDVRGVALAAYKYGLCPVPPRPDGSKAPIGAWEKYQRARPTRRLIEAWYGSHTGTGLVCGRISGNLECLEFEDPTVYEAYKTLAEATGLSDLVERIEAGYLEQSPSGGIHWLYRCLEISRNTKLARRPKTSEELAHPHDEIKTLIETRGEGGYVIIAPSFGPVHPSGKPYVLLRGGVDSIVTITPEEREALFELARTFDLTPKPEAGEGPRKPPSPSGTRPGDLLNIHSTWADILIPNGWALVYQRGEVGYWRRPGKDWGISATTNWQDSGLLYIFSTSTIFEPERGYTKFSALALLEHGGDFQSAAQSLVRQGYGIRRQFHRKVHHLPRPITTWEVRG